jgi:hypothetical protein
MFWFELCHPHIPVTNMPVTKPTRPALGDQPQVKVANTGLAIARSFATVPQSLARHAQPIKRPPAVSTLCNNRYHLPTTRHLSPCWFFMLSIFSGWM